MTSVKSIRGQQSVDSKSRNKMRKTKYRETINYSTNVDYCRLLQDNLDQS